MCSNRIAKVDIHGVLEFVRGREDFVELVRRHMGDDCAQLVRELLQEVMRQAEREYRWGDAWDDSFSVERMAALERRYQESIEEMQRNHQAEITRLESVIAHQAEQVKEMAVYKARAEAAEGAATDLCGDFVDFVCEGVGGNAAEYCANRSAECVDAYGECDMGSRFCKGFFPEAAREWTERSIQEE